MYQQQPLKTEFDAALATKEVVKTLNNLPWRDVLQPKIWNHYKYIKSFMIMCAGN